MNGIIVQAVTEYDFTVVGAGIVGVAVVRELARRFPAAHILLVDKEEAVALHQSGRNSGVIHAGVYYEPDSLKARLCRRGLEDTLELCRRYSIPYQQCGKIVVATNASESTRLDILEQRSQLNRLSPQRLSKRRLNELEPNIRGEEGLWIKQSGITDYAAVTRCLLQLARENNKTDTRFTHRVTAIQEQGDGMVLKLQGPQGEHKCKSGYLVSCAGAHSDELLRLQGLNSDIRIVPFKGEYFRLSREFNTISERLIYPVPDPQMPFLGVHLTRMVGGYTTVGPNAALAWGREAYEGFRVGNGEWLENLSFRGLWRCLWHYRGAICREALSSLSRHYYASLVRQYCPAIRAHHFRPYRPGIRAQAVSGNGELVQDFKFVETRYSLHVLNAPSPAATSAIPIAREIVARISGKPKSMQ
ncbi:L-2-hydroxyglutarate oxidase [Alteromonas aestuariivivens]|uniref:L-2-hydroxyglutarate oxidase n=1 Tax=Alteromonas aestuariivivens TaxID=1938339 RepID=A0A3D8M860_9ALTE|nr:L-2-hydroxyglutarate oxidase [Alteromonas aestuariivivens]RDV26075.1 L-2-hydroxyglutarate oxidase [Alteromonas aestuariivivens]